MVARAERQQISLEPLRDRAREDRRPAAIRASAGSQTVGRERGLPIP